ncbi:MAG: hypothetical protein LBQ23_00815 [Puniceicoccales bacterium]|jgi:hypothetical protein|nr:hypothetical protein [Puniceicoccales bacterium]
MSIIATENGASAAAKGSEVHQSLLLTHKAIKYKSNSSSLGLLGIITSSVAKLLCSRKVSQTSEKFSIIQKEHMQLCLFTGKGPKPRLLSCVQIFSKNKS